MTASKTASNRAQRTDVVLHAGDRPKTSVWARFVDDCFAHQEVSAADAESELRFTPRALRGALWYYASVAPEGRDVSFGLRQAPRAPGCPRARE
jgi:hypothetical protein